MRNRLSSITIMLLLAAGVRAEVVQIDLGGAVDKQVIKAAGGGAPQHFGENPGASQAYVENGYNDGVTVANGLPTNHDARIGMLVAGVDSNRVLEAVTIGNDPNRWRRDLERWGGLFAMNALTTTNDSPRSTPLEWLLRKQNATTGLVDSQDDPNGWNVAYTYDEALSAVAFAAYGSNQQAQAILSFLRSAQDANGSFVSAFDTANGNSAWSTHYVGNNAWVILAINYYTGRTGDRQFLGAATNCANWILQYQAADGSISMGPDNPTAYSTEHNLDAWSALYHLSKLVTNSSYRLAADRILSWLETAAWINGEGYFSQGKNDTFASLDPNTFGIMALGVTGTNGDDYTRCFTKMVNTMYLTNEGFTGFSFNESADTSMGCVWFEGTAQAALAYGLAGQAGMSSFLDAQVSNSARGSGGMPYTTGGNGSGDVNTSSAASTACWYLFSHLNPVVNPFRPFDRPLVLTCAATGGQCRLTWPANAETKYQIQQSTNLVTWTNAPSAGGLEGQSLQTASNWEDRAYQTAMPADRVFYRASIGR